jgi:hypothetical protein
MTRSQQIPIVTVFEFVLLANLFGREWVIAREDTIFGLGIQLLLRVFDLSFYDLPYATGKI